MNFVLNKIKLIKIKLIINVIPNLAPKMKPFSWELLLARVDIIKNEIAVRIIPILLIRVLLILVKLIIDVNREIPIINKKNNPKYFK